MGKKHQTIGWREWVKLPDLSVPYIKAKIDTGARTSSLHAFDLRVIKRRGVEFVQFDVHPNQRDKDLTITAEAKILEYRKVKSSTGHASLRPVIVTPIELMGETWEIELTLANRDEMGFRMLIGREGIRGKMLVDAGKSYYGGKPPKAKRKAKKKKITRRMTK